MHSSDCWHIKQYNTYCNYNILCLDPKTCADVELDSTEWEIKTITSAIKHYLRYQPDRCVSKAFTWIMTLHFCIWQMLYQFVCSLENKPTTFLPMKILLSYSPSLVTSQMYDFLSSVVPTRFFFFHFSIYELVSLNISKIPSHGIFYHLVRVMRHARSLIKFFFCVLKKVIYTWHGMRQSQLSAYVLFTFLIQLALRKFK